MKPVDLLYLGMGAAFLAKDKVEAMLDDMEKRGEISRKEAAAFVEEAKERARKEQESLDARVREQVKQAIESLGLATKEDIADLKKLLKKS